jgi:DNA repair protein RecN (Recombination protein N)|tara:strand:+ start:2191 stop:3837 length:1647 start_codon:yes stop_codon:yes gene_type:complete
MLQSINIKKFALFSNTEVNFNDGMTALSGETGAGKSIIIDAIGLLMGRKNIRKIKEDDIEMSCCFELKNQQIKSILHQNEFIRDGENTCIIRLKIVNNTSKHYINDIQVTKTKLNEIGSFLIDIYGQNENRFILKNEVQLNKLDSYSKNLDDIKLLNDIYNEIIDIKRKIDNMSKGGLNYEEHIEILEEEIKEISNYLITKDEFDNILREIKVLSNSEETLKNVNECYEKLYNNESFNIYSELSNVSNTISDISDIDHKIRNLADQINNSLDEIKDISKEIQHYRDSIEINPEKLNSLNLKITELNEIFRKYKTNESEIIKLHSNKTKELEDLLSNKKDVAKLNEKYAKLMKKYHPLAKNISKIRSISAKNFENDIVNQLSKLNMDGCEFKIKIDTDCNIVSATGYDNVNFLIKTNKKTQLLPIKDIASGGELSRISLVIQLLARNNNDSETMIFDEVDTGIGGATSEVIGMFLSKLSKNAQVFCVTHQAQIAGKAANHFLIEKNNNLAEVKITELSMDERINEIARMIGGVDVTNKTLEYANEILSK